MLGVRAWLGWLNGGRATAAVLALALISVGCIVESEPPTASVPSRSPGASLVPWSGVGSSAPILGGPTFGGPGNQYIFDATAHGDGFVAVGEDFRSDMDVTGRIWLSPDGETWGQLADPDRVFADAEVDEVASAGGRLVAFGAVRHGDASSKPQPIVWTSADGTLWHRSAQAAATIGRLGAYALAAGRDGFVAWGALESGAPSVLTSADGESWLPSDFTALYPDGQINDMAATGQGWIAVGSQRPATFTTGGRPEPAEAWFSTDGAHWQAASIDGLSLGRVAAGAFGAMAVGAGACGGCVGPGNLWHSEDGSSWRLVGPDSSTNTTYASEAGRIVRVVIFDSISLAWSSDGLGWQPMADGLGLHSEYGALAVGARGVLLLENPTGVGGSFDEVDAGVWFLPAH